MLRSTPPRRMATVIGPRLKGYARISPTTRTMPANTSRLLPFLGDWYGFGAAILSSQELSAIQPQQGKEEDEADPK